ncbi:MAG: hypothetical protein ACXABY_30775, partial [Candidatus Thorarchaeota archaeon]
GERRLGMLAAAYGEASPRMTAVLQRLAFREQRRREAIGEVIAPSVGRLGGALGTLRQVVTLPPEIIAVFNDMLTFLVNIAIAIALLVRLVIGGIAYLFTIGGLLTSWFADLMAWLNEKWNDLWNWFGWKTEPGDWENFLTDLGSRRASFEKEKNRPEPLPEGG